MSCPSDPASAKSELKLLALLSFKTFLVTLVARRRLDRLSELSDAGRLSEQDSAIVNTERRFIQTIHRNATSILWLRNSTATRALKWQDALEGISSEAAEGETSSDVEIKASETEATQVSNDLNSKTSAALSHFCYVAGRVSLAALLKRMHEVTESYQTWKSLEDVNDKATFYDDFTNSGEAELGVKEGTNNVEALIKTLHGATLGPGPDFSRDTEEVEQNECDLDFEKIWAVDLGTLMESIAGMILTEDFGVSEVSVLEAPVKEEEEVEEKEGGDEEA